MTGCRHGAKNTLNENYLYLAEKAGAVVHPLTTVVSVTDDSRGGYAVATLPTDRNARAGAAPSRPAVSSSRPARTAPRPCCTG